MSNTIPDTPTQRTWRIDHPLFESPLEMEGVWSENVMQMFAVIWLDQNLPHPSGDTWLIEKDNLTMTVVVDA